MLLEEKYKTIEEVIPHRKGMKLIDKIISLDKDQIICEAIITDKNLFYDNKINGVNALIGAEFIAQTVSAFSGSIAKDKNNENKTPNIGFLLSVRNFSSKITHFNLGNKLDIKAKRIYLANGVGVFEGKIIIDNKEVISAKINAYQPDKEKIKLILKGEHKI